MVPGLWQYVDGPIIANCHRAVGSQDRHSSQHTRRRPPSSALNRRRAGRSKTPGVVRTSLMKVGSGLLSEGSRIGWNAA
jgi:hypothetical protein